MLQNIKSPEDIKKLTYGELETLAGEIREKIISTVSSNGGHLASNLGFVEATLAIHRVFDAPRDKIIFDVSHQCYAHKLITGRYEKFDTLRRCGGISGFTNPRESEYDAVVAGHSGSSISTALGMATAAKLSGSDEYFVAVVGDGSFTNGMIYEAINNCAMTPDLNLIIILNDNKMSISENVGGMSRYLSHVRTSRGYLKLKHSLDDFFAKIPVVGLPIAHALKWIKDSFKSIFIHETLFENLGIPYIGPVDGNDTERVETVLADAKKRGGVWLVHLVTKKGLGYGDAEAKPELYHSTGAFDPSAGLCGECGDSFTSRFGEIICECAEKDENLCAVTGAMRDGVGLKNFAERFPRRYCDVGIAEEHAVALCGGLSLSGMNPVFAVYSTFSQRVFDQVFHDIALNRAHMTLALDHCGIVPGDGITHQGVYDVPLFSPIPGVTIYSPETYGELDRCLRASFADDGISIVRYPKGGEHKYDRSSFTDDGDVTVMMPEKIPEAVIVTYGIITEEAVRAAQMLEGEFSVGIIKLVRVHPLDKEKLLPLLDGVRLIYVLEEGMRAGGVGEAVASAMATSAAGCNARMIIRAIDGEFVPHGDRASLLRLFGLDAESAANEIKTALSAGGNV